MEAVGGGGWLAELTNAAEAAVSPLKDAEAQAAEVRKVCAELRGQQGAVLALHGVKGFRRLHDASQAVVLASLLSMPRLRRLALRGCGAAEQSGLALAQLVTPPGALRILDVRDNMLGEAGLLALAGALSSRSVLTQLLLREAHPAGPVAASVVEALASAARRCTSLRYLALGEVEAVAGGSGGALARLQQAALANHEANAAALNLGEEVGEEGEASGKGGCEEQGEQGEQGEGAVQAEGEEDDELGADALQSAIEELRSARPRTLRLAHLAAVASAPLPRHVALVRQLRDCGSLRVVSLVNLGLGDALAGSLARALPRLASLRLLDISHNLLSGRGLEMLGAALTNNHSLLHVSALPQWLPPPAAVEDAWRGRLAQRRLKFEVAVLRAQGLVSARGDSGEPQVSLECGGGQLASTQPARSGAADPSWLETFTLCIPASALLLPSGRVQPDGGALHVSVRDTCTSSKATGEIEMASCDVPLAALLHRDATTVTCALEPPASFRQYAGRPAASLELRLRVLHVGEAQPDDVKPGVPRAFVERRTADGSKRKQNAAAIQASFRGRSARRHTTGLLTQARSLAEEIAAAATAASAAAAAAATMRLRAAGSSRLVAQRRRRRNERKKLLLSLALVACVAAGLLLFYLSESSQCQLAGSPGACIAPMLGLR